ncbi:MAG: AAA family ATPase [bacterium]|nr:AAA family ATPase [bacterium]
MIDTIDLKHVGPASAMKIDFAPGLNILTGDNGLGRTGAKGKTQKVTAAYNFNKQEWIRDKADSFHSGIVLYIQADGGVSVSDCAKNYPPGESMGNHFDSHEIFNGSSNGDRVRCNGLIRDWVSWQYQKKDLFEIFTPVLEILSPGINEVLRPGEPTRVSVDDARDIPTIKMPYGSVPVTHTSAGMRRVLSLAYFVVWAWDEHRAASALLNREPTDKLVILFDEVESHLHPEWQRVFMPSLFEAIKILEPALDVQVIASTHAPMVLASLEPIFSEDTDSMLVFELENRSVSVNEIPWAKQGDAVNWLVSDAFGLRQARSRDAEKAIEAAQAFMRDDMKALPEGLKTQEAIHRELLRVLSGHDTFWPRWIIKTENGAE